MARACTICTHPDHKKIDADLVLRTDTIGVIATRYGVSKSALDRHLGKGHIAASMSKAVTAISESKAVMDKGQIIASILDLSNKQNLIAEEALKARNFAAATGALKEVRAIEELKLKLLGELKQEGQTTVNVGVQLNIDEELERCIRVRNADRQRDRQELH